MIKQSGSQYATANFYFPNENGPDVIMELVTKENPMTPERERKIHAFRASGYTVLVWHEDDINTFEKLEKSMRKLNHLLGQDNEEELERYKDLRRENYRALFGG